MFDDVVRRSLGLFQAHGNQAVEDDQKRDPELTKLRTHAFELLDSLGLDSFQGELASGVCAGSVTESLLEYESPYG